jgi:hypothetical protein
MKMFVSSSAVRRLAAAREFVLAHALEGEVVSIGETRDAADDLAREIAAARPATFGLHRFSLTQFIARTAALELARLRMAPASPLGVQAVAARAVFEVSSRGELHYLDPIAGTPGFSRALASTIRELRLAGVLPPVLGGLTDPGPDLSALLREFGEQLDRGGIADRAATIELAIAAITRRASALSSFPILLLDVALETAAEQRLIATLAGSSRALFATVPAGDVRTLACLRDVDPDAAVDDAPDREESTLGRLRTFLFAGEPPDCPADGLVSLFSAPGEAREAVEIARLVLEEARRGVPFDRIAILLRAPELYSSPLETALQRANIPAMFTRGTKRPDPAGRAFLALLACRAEEYSASRFAEYLSLGQVPDDSRPRRPSPPARWVPPDDEAFAPVLEALHGTAATSGTQKTEGTDAGGDACDSDVRPSVAGTLRAPWRWERLVVDAKVIGGRERWTRRIDGLARELGVRLAAIRAEEPDSARAAAIEREIVNLDHLKGFTLPLIDALAALPDAAHWAEWIDVLQGLARSVLRRPDRVLTVLAELGPMGAIGPIGLDEVRLVLAERLTLLEQEPPARRYGRVLVATLEQIRGRAFDVVFVPGLAERIFPQRLREDPLLLDDLRTRLSPALTRQADRRQRERLLLHLAAGAATRRLHLSYPRIELGEARPRVPSFYALDVTRAITGRIPDFEELSEQAAEAARARLAWPAPADAARAIDDMEHDLAVLDPLLHRVDPALIRGRARYLLDLNPSLARSLRARWARWQSAWTPYDGLSGGGEPVAAALAAHHPSIRPYSVSALQRFAVCPYQFYLSAILRLAPRDEIESIERMDPLTRGSLFHRVQALFMRSLREITSEPLSPAGADHARELLDAAIDRVAAEYHEELAPAIERIWRDEIGVLRADLHGWLERAIESQASWEPLRFEYGFGFSPGEDRDPSSRPDPVTLPGGWKLHGVVDLIERRRGTRDLRVTDHKTGRNNTRTGMIVGNGEVLQPVLYALAVEAALDQPVVSSRLFYCTAAASFSEREVPLNESARRSGTEVIEIVDRAIRAGFLPAAPRERACGYCDFRQVCGPDEERRVLQKHGAKLADLFALRELP